MELLAIHDIFWLLRVFLFPSPLLNIFVPVHYFLLQIHNWKFKEVGITSDNYITQNLETRVIFQNFTQLKLVTLGNNVWTDNQI